ncbi:NAD(P)H-dependent oxidoreductase [Brachyspira catarrhinii]|uniref:Flavodoxin family protein n=1 Tax=Brachyspira catarrhinii TaxID=2528966 RepID=A0ABY2TSN2_9SPIR|nr:NAD(P)H-dependent oxidoreductase [Brachyspira catarrhinii]TKZ35900.1 flavodoxin family protein [Brachyspira catarrhinii]
MKNLIIFAHTFWKNSKVNRALLEELKDNKNVNIHNLSVIYPDGKINSVKSEVTLLKEADNIIFQFPLFWYSMPSILKEWQDIVLADILYGSEPKALENKTFKIITTAGSEKSFYDTLDFNMNEILSPINLSFKFIGVKIEEPFCIYGANKDNLPIKEYLNIFK